jgi:hypothetical protein
MTSGRPGYTAAACYSRLEAMADFRNVVRYKRDRDETLMDRAQQPGQSTQTAYLGRAGSGGRTFGRDAGLGGDRRVCIVT